MQARLRPAENRDWYVFYGERAPQFWHGYVAEGAHMLLGLGGVYLGQDGKIIATFSKARGVCAPVLMNKAARRVFADLKRDKIETVFAVPEPGIVNAEKWLTRLGFSPTDETINGLTYWQWQQQLS